MTDARIGRLLIISHPAHRTSDQVVAAWGPTVREIDHIASLFDEVVHVAPLHPGSPTASDQPYA